MHNATAIVCLEGDIVEAITTWLRRHLPVPQFNLVTDTAPERVLTQGTETQQFALYHQLAHIWETQGAQPLILAAHAPCVGYSRQHTREQQLMLHHAAQTLRERFPESMVVALWVDEHHTVTELSDLRVVGLSK